MSSPLLLQAYYFHATRHSFTGTHCILIPPRFAGQDARHKRAGARAGGPAHRRRGIRLDWLQAPQILHFRSVSGGAWQVVADDCQVVGGGWGAVGSIVSAHPNSWLAL